MTKTTNVNYTLFKFQRKFKTDLKNEILSSLVSHIVDVRSRGQLLVADVFQSSDESALLKNRRRSSLHRGYQQRSGIDSIKYSSKF